MGKTDAGLLLWESVVSPGLIIEEPCWLHTEDNRGEGADLPAIFPHLRKKALLLLFHVSISLELP